MFHTKTPNKHH
jgi:hypothetical protein